MPQGIMAMKKLSESDDSDSKLEKGDSMCIKEWAIIEVQGSLECKSGSTIGGKLIGQLIFSSKERIILIGFCILHEQVVEVSSAICVLKNNGIPDVGPTTVSEDKEKTSSNHLVSAVVNKGVVFHN